MMDPLVKGVAFWLSGHSHLSKYPLNSKLDLLIDKVTFDFIKGMFILDGRTSAEEVISSILEAFNRSINFSGGELYS